MTNSNNEKSIVSIEKKIEEIRKSDKAKTKASLAEIKRLQSRLNKIYAEYKRKLMELEKSNNNKLLFLRSTKGFYKLFGNSLYFYAFNIAPKLNIDVRVFSDGDYEEKSEAGVVSVKNLEEIEKLFLELKIKRANTRDKTGNIVVYKLPWSYTDEEIQKYVEQNTYELHKYNHVIVAENTIPVLYLNLNELLKISYENVRRLEPVARETLGNIIIDITAEMIRIYIEMANGRINEVKGLQNLKIRLNKIKSQVKILADLKLWNARTYARVGESMIKIQDIIELKLNSSK
ncbi:hypothetical protein IJJ05_00100 [Candidatus Saccharibacteria bacterium]|nr:hypothetical protein [Candidatus Saccharibacteria bacterium]